MKIWLDDVRDAPQGWIRVFTAKSAIKALMSNEVEVISLDHDLGDDVLYGTGYDVVTWIEENCACGKRYNIPEIRVHSANPVGVQNMLNGIKSINRMRSREEY